MTQRIRLTMKFCFAVGIAIMILWGWNPNIAQANSTDFSPSTRPNYEYNNTLPFVSIYQWNRNYFGTISQLVSESPILLTPGQKAVINDSTPLFEWNPIAGVSQYKIQMSSDKRFNSISHEYIVDSALYEYNAEPLEEGRYFWRVRAQISENDYGPWSNIWFFSIDTTPPTPPILQKPGNNSTLTVITSSFSWRKPTKDTAQYQLQISDSEDIDTGNKIIDTVIDKKNKYSITDTNLLSYGVFYWRVRAIDKAENIGDWSDTYSFTITLMKSPSEGGIVFTQNPSFTWNKLKEASEYNIQIDNDYDFSSILSDQNIQTTSFTQEEILDHGEYYWRLRVKVNDQWSIWMPTWRFIISPLPPDEPILISPNNKELVPDFLPLFQWSESNNGVIFYQIEIATDPKFSSIAVGDFTSAPTTSYTPAQDLLPDTKYYWHVRGLNQYSVAGDWSKTSLFMTSVSTPLITAPEPSIITLSLRPEFSWEEVTNAIKYEIQISDVQENFEYPVLTTLVSDTSYSPTEDLPINTTLWWKVRATGKNGWGDWSQVNEFSTPDPPTTPEPISPLNTAIDTYQPTLSWQESINFPHHYQIQVSSSSSFEELILNIETDSLEYTISKGLLGDFIEYYWRVRAINEAGYLSNWSTVYWFGTPGSISGKAINSVTGKGIREITIQVTSKFTTLEVITNKMGDFSISGLPSGKYTLTPQTQDFVFKPVNKKVSLKGKNVTGISIPGTELLDVAGWVTLDPRSNLATSAQQVAMLNNGVYSLVEEDKAYAIVLEENPDINLSATGWTGNNILDDLLPPFLQELIWKSFTKSNFPEIKTSPRNPQYGTGLLSNLGDGVADVKVSDNQRNQTTTEQTGDYGFVDVTAGNYTIKASLAGYRSIPDNRSFSLSDDTEDQYFMISPSMKPTYIKIFSHWDNFYGRLEFSADGHYVIGAKGIYDLFNVEQTSSQQFNSPDISGDGRYIVYSTLYNSTTGSDVYLIDRDSDEDGIFDETGETTETWISKKPDGSASDEEGYYTKGARISDDGSQIVYTAKSVDLDPDHADHCINIYVYDVSKDENICLTAPLEVQQNDVYPVAGNPEISSDGRFVVFGTQKKLIESDTNDKSDIYFYDRDPDENGVFDEEGLFTIERVSLKLDGQQSYYHSRYPSISANGKHIVYTSNYCDLDTCFDTVYIKDRTKDVIIPITEHTVINGHLIKRGNAHDPKISSDGRYVVFWTDNTTFTPPLIYFYDRDTDFDGVYDEAGATKLTNLNFDLHHQYSYVSISSDGRFVAFQATSGNPGALTGTYIYDRGTFTEFSITGRVTDEFGNPVPGVNISTIEGRAATTDANGFYSLLGLPAGTFYITPSKDGNTFTPPIRSVNLPPSAMGQNFHIKLNFNEDFSGYPISETPDDWVELGSAESLPTVEEVGGSGTDYQAIIFPSPGEEPGDNWLLKSDFSLSESYQVTTKLTFDLADSGKAGITIAWDESTSDHIDILADFEKNTIEATEYLSGEEPSSLSIDTLDTINIEAGTPYWLRIEAVEDVNYLSEMDVYWSTDGVDFSPILHVTGVNSIAGLTGMSVSGDQRDSIVFDDFSIQRLYIDSSVEGFVTNVQNEPIQGIQISDGNGGHATTDEQGMYKFSKLPAGSYTFSPQENDFIFLPASISLDLNSDEIDGLNFTGVKVYSISGTVTNQNGEGFEGVTIKDDQGRRTKTNSNGYYSLDRLPPGSFITTPLKLGYKFSPEYKNLTIKTSDFNNINFKGSPLGSGMQLVAWLDQSAKEIAVKDNFAYFGGYSSGLHIFDISDPISPVEIGHSDGFSSAETIALNGNYAYIVDYTQGVRVIDISNPERPIKLVLLAESRYPFDIAISNNALYVADLHNCISIYDISNPESPIHINNIGGGNPCNPYKLVVNGNRLYSIISSSQPTVNIYDISNPLSPQVIGTYELGFVGHLHAVDVIDNTLVIGYYDYVSGNGEIRILDVTDPGSINLIGIYNQLVDPEDIVIKNNRLYVADGDNGIRILDISNPSDIHEVGFFTPPRGAWEIFLVDQYLYSTRPLLLIYYIVE